MKKLLFKTLALTSILSLTLTSCFKDLDLKPAYGNNAQTVYEDPNNYIHVLAKLYAGFTMTGNKGPAGQADISGIDEGFSQYTRVLWNLQELPTDEAICGWNDPGMPEMNKMTWSSDNPWVKGMYYRIYFEIAQCNEFIKEASDAKLAERGFSESDQARIRQYRNEARFLRALTYYHLMDLYGKGPFIDENSGIGSFYPAEISRGELFDYVESELLAVAPELGAPRFQYARVDKAVAWTLLARLYLNAQIYKKQGAVLGPARFEDCIRYCDSVIQSGAYSLEPNYEHLFLADNNLSNEIIFPIICDGLYTQSYGGTTFLVHASVGGSMQVANFGIAPGSGWAGLRAKKNLPLAMDTTDGRYLFYTTGQTLDINVVTTFTNGYAVTKWKNLDRNGNPGSDPTKTFVDTDFPMFRLADVYLMYAEAAARNASNANQTLAIRYVNDLRERAFGNTSQNVTSITPEDILTERMRELYWEGTRRTDLIRFDKFTSSSYLWPFKGGNATGVGVDDHLNIYPIPASDLTANPNLTQNPGY
jgi:hypothetical protein